MTEKRFIQVIDGVKDTRTKRTLTCPLEFTLKLNELNDLYDYVFDRNEKLEKENEQLKQEMGDLGTAHADEINKIEDGFYEEILKLEKENEQLKKEVDELEQENEQLENKLWNCQNFR